MSVDTLLCLGIAGMLIITIIGFIIWSKTRKPKAPEKVYDEKMMQTFVAFWSQLIFAFDDLARLTKLPSYDCQVLLVGENYYALSPKQDFAWSLKESVELGFTDLVIELDENLQQVIDVYAQGSCPITDLIALCRRAYPVFSRALEGFAEAKAHLIETAVTAGLRVHAIGPVSNQLESDVAKPSAPPCQKWLKRIGQILRENPNARILGLCRIEHVSEQTNNISSMAETIRLQGINASTVIYAGGIKADSDDNSQVFSCEIAAQKLGFAQRRFLVDGSGEADYILHLPQTEELFQKVHGRWTNENDRFLASSKPTQRLLLNHPVARQLPQQIHTARPVPVNA